MLKSKFEKHYLPTNISGASISIYTCMKRYTDGKGDKLTAITVCGVDYLFCKDLPFYCSISKCGTKVTPSPIWAHTASEKCL